MSTPAGSTETPTDGVTAAQAATYAGAPDASKIGDDLSAARALVVRHCGSRLASVPVSVLRSAVLDVTSALWARREHHNGIATFADSEGGVTPVRLSRDPMASAYPILAPFLGPAIA